ncbi:DUF4231 domain-containing protein [Kineosporia babensis]|uniref:DUF4231 domain-containing protein n=1 Tax=Kineosporia babensis TaxID=499548 RepID=A0A9X1NIK9_9ACTN|nr:DUF4231 domain-containing protein [Kineosporia babensis]MCD5314489.1 DUF4231 domain-containing protein [Kineosporia babensis]
MTDEDLPECFKGADRASLAGQKLTLRYTALRLGGSLLAALGGAGSFAAGDVDLAAILILIGFLVAAGAELALWAQGPERLWYQGRALAESAKTLAWRYAVTADPFPADLPDQAARDLLRARIGDLWRQIPDVLVEMASGPMVTPKMQELREASFEQRRAAYVEGRTQEQAAWYRRKARHNLRRTQAARFGLLALEAFAVLFAALRLFAGWNFDAAGFVGALIAAGTAWMAIKQFGTLAASYAVAARELTLQADRLGEVEEAEWADTAADAEEAISREHTMWLASRSSTATV